MRLGLDRKGKCSRRRATVLLLLGAAALSGCSSLTGGGSGDETSSLGSRFSSLFSSAKPGVSQPKSPTPTAPEVPCPGVDIRQGASTLNIAAKTAQATVGDLRYQLSFGQTARECHVQDGVMSLKVGVQGRIILGPMGGPGTVDIPLRYAVVREGPEPKTIVTKFKRLPVSIGPDQSYLQFVDVEEGLTFPVPSNSELDAYVIYVGFDEMGDRNERRPPRTAKRPAPRSQ